MADCYDLFSALPTWLGILGGQLLLITIPAGATFLILHRWKRNPLRGRKIQVNAVAHTPAVRREVCYSILTSLVFALNGFCIYTFMDNGWTLVYAQPSNYGLLYGAFSLIAAIVLHDAYFYWTHRLMHHPRLFYLFHYLHHKSHSPSPWAAYAFTPLEAVVQTMFLTILIFILPLNVTVIYIFMVHMIVRNVIGHSGFELFPRGTTVHRIFGILTTNTHHDLHHSSMTGNYGLYFTWWDRLCNTEHPDYHSVFESVTSGRAADAGKRKSLSSIINA